MSKYWNCIQEAFTRENIKLAFRKAYFAPLHEGEYIVIRQTLKAGIMLSKETERQTEQVTGIVTSDSATEKI